MRIINYSYNWNNKLLCDCWSTIRLANCNKYQLHETYEHRLIKKDNKFSFIRLGKLVYLKTINLYTLTNAMSFMDCALSKPETIALLKTMYKNKNIDWETQKLFFIIFSSKCIYN